MQWKALISQCLTTRMNHDILFNKNFEFYYEMFSEIILDSDLFDSKTES